MENQRLDFIYAAIEDLQGTIRSIDVKAEVLLVAMTVPLMDAAGVASAVSLLLHNRCWGLHFAVIAAALALVFGWGCAFYFLLRVLVAANNPSKAVPGNHANASSFYAGSLFRFTRRDVLFDRVVQATVTVDAELAGTPSEEPEIARALTFEKMKLGFIAARKIHMFNFAIRLTIAGGIGAVILFGCHLFV